MNMAVIKSIFNEDRNVISYRPAFARLTGSVTAAILLRQAMYWWEQSRGEAFYKFKEPCKHKAYKPGDSWCEELSFTRSEFDLAVDKIGTKITEGKSKAAALAWELPRFEDFPDAESYNAAFNIAIEHIAVYWTDSNRLTWYVLNEAVLYGSLTLLYSLKQIPALPRKTGFQLYLDKADSSFTCISETTTETTTEDQKLGARNAPPPEPTDSNPDLNGDQDQEKRKSSGKKKKAANVPDPEPGVLDAICLLCYGTRAAWSTNGASIRGCYNKLAKVDSPITVDKLGEFYLWWKANDWRGRKGQKPEPHQVIQTWPVAMSESVNGDKELFGGKTEEDRYDESAWR